MTMRVSVPSILMAVVAASAMAASTPNAPAQPASAAPVKAGSAEVKADALFIVQGKTMNAALKSVRAVGAEAHQELEIIRAVSANLTPSQVGRLRAEKGLRVYEDRALSTRGWLDSLLKTTVNDTNSTVANVPLLQPVTGNVAFPLVGTLTTTPLVSRLTSPIVKSLSQSSSLQDDAELRLTHPRVDRRD
jgi:hypothetical protein